ncbi:MAG: uncultured phage MedDCM-OCT-S30-C28 [Bacteroidota bacterium]|jgi:hypothetical protein
MKYSSSFSHDLAFGEQAEDWVNDLFNNPSKIKIEVKHDRIAHKTGNVFIEYESRGQKSGIATTDADYWIYKIERTNCSIILPTDYLKNRLRNYYQLDMYKSNGGDDNTSKGFLVPISVLMTINDG